MISLKSLIDQAFRVEHHLMQHESYLAHPPTETLAEHAGLVLEFFDRLCDANGIESTLNAIVESLVESRAFQNRTQIAEHIKRLFVAAIAFHDTGKINENFQSERMKNALFPSRKDTIILPAHGHSGLGAFIFIVHHIDSLSKEGFSDEDELMFFGGIILVLSISIFLHHIPSMYGKPMEVIESKSNSKFLENLDFLDTYLQKYKFDTPSVSSFILAQREMVLTELIRTEKSSFALFSLLRLNFSLLTASDYLATSRYISGIPIKDFGLIGDDLRQHIIKSSRTSLKYNAKAYERVEILRGQKIDDLPQNESGDNLNILREAMAITAIQEVRANADKRLFYLEAPTGGGKTNISMLVASELLAHNPELNKVFYVFPFTTLITQTHKAILKMWDLTGDEVALMHSKAGFQTKAELTENKEEKEDGIYGAEKLNQLNNLFAFYPICLTTHIRFFDILKSNDKETNYLMHRLANSIVILDELQSYNPMHWDKMMYHIDQYARLFNIRFVLMSATLPKISKLDLPLENRPDFVELLPNAKSFFTNRNFANRVRFKFDLLKKYGKINMTLQEVATEVIEKSKNYTDTEGSVHTIIEFIFKKSASEFAALMDSSEHPFDKIFVLSGTILEPRRRQIINFLKNKDNRKLNILLITTQVVEAGVDIDMDLGFKNTSLIDSDEQLAGRVNRNVLKNQCEVYLFKVNEAFQLYGKDYRYTATRELEWINPNEHEEILKTKNFEKLYNQVLKRIDKQNQQAQTVNFKNDYLIFIQNLDYKKVHENFKLIDQRNISIFVPLKMSLKVESEEAGDFEDIFSSNEIKFLKDFNIHNEGETEINGKAIWLLYRNLIENKIPDFTKQIVSMKTIQGILSKFTFSIFESKDLKANMTKFLDLELSFDKYWYLNLSSIYSLENGLMTERLGDSEYFIF